MTQKNLFIILSATLLLFGSLLGCTSGGYGISNKNAYCTHNYNPLKIEGDNAYKGKLQVKPGEPFSPQTGTYAYKKSEVYYYDATNDIKIHVMESVDGSGSKNKSIVCAGGKGISPEMQSVNFSIPVVSDIKVIDAGHIKIKTRLYHIDAPSRKNQGWLEYDITEQEIDYVDGSPQNIYNDYPAIDQFYFLTLKSSPTAYQLIAHLNDTMKDQKSGKDVNISIRSSVVYNTPQPIE